MISSIYSSIIIAITERPDPNGPWWQVRYYFNSDYCTVTASPNVLQGNQILPQWIVIA